MSTLVHNYEGSYLGNQAAPSAKPAKGQQSGSTPLLFGRTGEAGVAPGHSHPLECDSNGYGTTRTVEGHAHQIERFVVGEGGSPPHVHPLDRAALMPKQTMSGNVEETPLYPHGIPTVESFNARQGGKPILRYPKVLVQNAEGDDPMGVPVLEEPCDDCPDHDLVANRPDEEAPLGDALSHFRR